MNSVKKYLAVMMSIFMIASMCPATVYASVDEGDAAEVPSALDADESSDIAADDTGEEVPEEIVGAVVQVGDGRPCYLCGFVRIEWRNAVE